MSKALILFLLCINIYAQDSVYTLSPVEVTAGRSLLNNFQSYDLVDQSAVQTGEAGLSMQESLYIIPGLMVNNRNNPSMGDKISIRGIGARASFGVRGIKILLDNIPLTLPDGQTQTNNIELLSTGSIEILKGPASSFYGNAAGGVINIRSEIPSDKIISVSPQVILGENNLKKYSLKLSGGMDKHSYLVSLVNTNYKGFREHSEMRTYQLNSLYRYSFNNGKLSAIVNYFNSPYLQNPSSVSKEMLELNRTSARDFVKQQGAGEKADQFQTGINFNFNKNDLSFTTTAYYLKRNLVNPIPGRIIELYRNAGGIRSSAAYTKRINNMRLNVSAGLDIEHQDDDRTEFINNGLININSDPADVFSNLSYGDMQLNQNESITSAGPFVSAELFINNKLGLLAVLRYDHFNYNVKDHFSDNSGSRIMSQLSPSTGIMYRLFRNSRIYFNYSTSFQSPTAAELSNREDGLGGFNPGLDPENINQYEAGGDFLIDFLNTRISVALYYMNLDNLLIPYQQAGSEQIFYKNAGKALNRGIEIMTSHNPFNNTEISFSYNIMKFAYEDYTVEYEDNLFQLKDNNIPGLPQQTFSIFLHYLTGEGLWLKGIVQWNDEYYTNDFNGSPPGSSSPLKNFINDSWLLLNLRAGYKISFGNVWTDLSLGVNNILDEKYNGSVVPNAAGERFFEPSPGRNFYLGLQVSF